MATPKRILYVHYGDNWLRHNEVVLLDLLSRIDREQFLPYVWTNCEPLIEKCREMGIETQYSPFKLVGGWSTPRWDISAWNRLIKQGSELIEKHTIDLVHVNSGATCQWMCLATRMNHIPLVTQLHCHYPIRDRFSLDLHMSPKLICVSKGISQELARDGYPEENLHVIHNGVSLNRNDPSVDVKDYLGIPKNAFTFLSVGALIKSKGFDRLIRAIHMHNYHQNNPHLVIVGDGEEKAPLQQLTADLGVEDRVHFVGEQHNKDAWMTGNVDAFISGAYEEDYGLAIGQAALAKLPIVAPKIGVIPELVEHNHSALLYSNHGMAGLLNSVQRMLNDAPLRNKIAHNAYHYATQHLTVSASVSAIESIYHAELAHEPTASIPPSHSLKPMPRWLKHN
ncbi:glycosyl transferase [Vibrio sp. V1B]|uniref:glycosyltransferase n=1 Tax=Vibrio sp. V1B TaxID=2047825 RepID=UPI000BAEC339|nr:glycosyltransferase [Vibrio sp. V1B]PAW08853.1 glycosyl transferase [Vibrio sp. V1B]